MNDREIPDATPAAGASLFQAGVTGLNALRFRRMFDPHSHEDHDAIAGAAYFDYEVDSLDFYVQQVGAIYAKCPRCAPMDTALERTFDGAASEAEKASVAARRRRMGVLINYAPTGARRCVYCGRHYASDSLRELSPR